MKRKLFVVATALLVGWAPIARAEEPSSRLKISAAAVDSVVQESIKAERLAAHGAPRMVGTVKPNATMAQVGSPQGESWFRQNWWWVVPVVGAGMALAIVAATGGYSDDDPDYQPPQT